ncbi:MAG: LysR family transcriptional regulator [Arenimonas sp.]
MMMNLQRLRHLIALAEECHFARAAERVHLSQPAFSRSIQAIEREVGMQLFDRQSGDVHPTPAGNFLIARAHRLLFDSRCLQRDIDLFRDSQLGDTAFGVGPFPAATFMPEVVAQLRRLYPGVCLRLEVSNWSLLLDRLRTEDIEFFLADARSLPDDPTLEIKLLGRQNGGFYVRKGHPLAGKRCSLNELRTYGIAATRLPPAIKTAIAKQLKLPPGQELDLALECDDVSLLKSVAMSTDTVAGLTDISVRSEMQSGELILLQIKDAPALYSEMGLVSLRNRTPSPIAKQAITLITEMVDAMNTD